MIDHSYNNRDSGNSREWVMRANCRGNTNVDLFAISLAEQKEAAAKLCRNCVVQIECAAEALNKRIMFGVWGGLSERQRRMILRKNPDIQDWDAALRATVRKE